jgi:hypothetical protein
MTWTAWVSEGSSGKRQRRAGRGQRQSAARRQLRHRHNATLIVEFAHEQHQQGATPHEATQGAARIRFRPIVMISLAFIGGVAPLVAAT